MKLASLLPSAERGRERRMEPTCRRRRPRYRRWAKSKPVCAATGKQRSARRVAAPAEQQQAGTDSNRRDRWGRRSIWRRELIPRLPACAAGADVFSLGVLAFEMFTGRPPFISRRFSCAAWAPSSLSRRCSATGRVWRRGRPSSSCHNQSESRPSAQQAASALRSALWRLDRSA